MKNDTILSAGSRRRRWMIFPDFPIVKIQIVNITYSIDIFHITPLCSFYQNYLCVLVANLYLFFADCWWLIADGSYPHRTGRAWWFDQK
jgi:hypothetical protein